MADSPLVKRLGANELMPTERHYVPLGRGPRVFVSVAAWLILVVFFSLAFMGLGGVTLIPLIFIPFLVALYFNKLNRRNLQAVAVLSSNQVEEAAAEFELLSQKRWTSHHALYVYNRGVCYLLQGQVRKAYAIFNATEKSAVFEKKSLRIIRYHPAIMRGMTLAMMGEPEEASRAILVAERDEQPTSLGLLLLTRLMIECRSNRHISAHELAERRWESVEGALSGRFSKALRLVRAYSLAAAAPERAQHVEMLLGGLYPLREEDISWLYVEWPEMERFITPYVPELCA